MSLRHAANRFRRTPVSGWDGVQWVDNITRCAFMASDRFISDREYGAKLRNLLVDPEYPIPPEFKVVRIGREGQIYLVGRTTSDTAGATYSEVVSVHRAFYVCQVLAFVQKASASGLRTTPSKAVVGEYHCDRENITFFSSKMFPTVRFGDEVIILPAGTPVDTTNELVIGTTHYEVEEAYDMNGYRYCRCLMKVLPAKDAELTGTAVSESTTTARMGQSLYRKPFIGDAVADSEAVGQFAEQLDGVVNVDAVVDGAVDP